MSNLSLKKSSAVVFVVVIALVCFGLGFFTSDLVKGKSASLYPGQMMFGGGNTAYGQAGQRTAGGAQGAFRMARGGSGGGLINGTLIKKDDTSMTVKLADGSTKLILVTSSTKALKMADTPLSDFTEGSNIMVSGTTNSDGSITAQTVQTRPTPPAGSPTSDSQPAPSDQPKP